MGLLEESSRLKCGMHILSIYISRQPMFSMEFIDKWNLKKIGNWLISEKIGVINWLFLLQKLSWDPDGDFYIF